MNKKSAVITVAANLLAATALAGTMGPVTEQPSWPYLKTSALRDPVCFYFTLESLLFYCHKQVVHHLMIILSKFQATHDFHDLSKVAIMRHLHPVFSSK